MSLLMIRWAVQTEQSETVLALGKEALSRREGQAYKRDILLSMALAHCTLASTAFEKKDNVPCYPIPAFPPSIQGGSSNAMSAELEDANKRHAVMRQTSSRTLLLIWIFGNLKGRERLEREDYKHWKSRD